MFSYLYRFISKFYHLLNDLFSASIHCKRRPTIGTTLYLVRYRNVNLVGGKQYAILTSMARLSADFALAGLPSLAWRFDYIGLRRLR
jgi:hypothetical protein